MSLMGPPCLHCGLVTFANPCKLLAYDLEETAILGFAVECFMCKSKGPFASSPEEAIQRYSPWVSFAQRLPLEGQRVALWEATCKEVSILTYSERFSSSYATAGYTHWAPPLPAPETYLRVTTEVPVVEPLSPPPAEGAADATLIKDNTFDDDIPFSWAAFLPFIALFAHVKTLF